MRASGFVALGSVAAGVVACASLLGIDEPAFAELEGGVSADAVPADATAEGGPQPGDDGGDASAAVDAGEEAGETRCGGMRCPNECLDEICGSCPPGTTNIAPFGIASGFGQYSFYGFKYLNDRHLRPSWVGEGFVENADPVLQKAVAIDLPGPRDVTNVTVFGHRGAPAQGTDVTMIAVDLYVSSATVTKSYTVTPTSGDFRAQVFPTLNGVTRVRVRLTNAVGSTPGISEIEICATK